jgi:hypothetical protein
MRRKGNNRGGTAALAVDEEVGDLSPVPALWRSDLGRLIAGSLSSSTDLTCNFAFLVCLNRN